MTKGRQGKRDGPKATGVAFCGASQPRSFLSKGVFVKMATAEDGLFGRILMVAPIPNLFPPGEVQRYIGQLKATGVTELSRVFDGIFTQHQSGESRISTNRAKIAYNEYYSQVVQEQNARFQGGSAESGQSSSSSKDTKDVLRLSVILHVLFHAIDKALGLIPPASTLSLRISKEDVQRAIAINEYSVDVKSNFERGEKICSVNVFNCSCDSKICHPLAFRSNFELKRFGTLINFSSFHFGAAPRFRECGFRNCHRFRIISFLIAGVCSGTIWFGYSKNVF